jgi:hypothetical protein
MDYDDAMAVLCAWEGRDVLIIAFVEPGFSLRPILGRLSCEEEGGGILRAIVDPVVGDPVRIAFASGLFHDAEWVPGMEGRGLSVEQGAVRVDVFVED